jgi:3-hydroxybutyryl-CoA dehydrogenase
LSQIERVIVVGAGWVGRQVAAKLAASGLQVALVDRSADDAKLALQWMSRCVDSSDPLNMHAGYELDSSSTNLDSKNDAVPLWLENVSILGGLGELTKEAVHAWRPDLVLECVPEQLSLKKRVLRSIAELVDSDCIIASNSSYFVPSVLMKFVSCPERFLHLHFHVPVMRDTVVDIVGCEQTLLPVIERVAALTRRVGQYPLVLRREHPGYVFNWLLQSMLKAALELVAQDVVDANEVDRSWKSVTGMPIGPFGLMDQIGLDVIEQVLSNARWYTNDQITDEQLLDVIRPLIAQGKLGMKSGAGFYDYRLPD